MANRFPREKHPNPQWNLQNAKPNEKIEMIFSSPNRNKVFNKILRYSQKVYALQNGKKTKRVLLHTCGTIRGRRDRSYSVDQSTFNLIALAVDEKDRTSMKKIFSNLISTIDEGRRLKYVTDTTGFYTYLCTPGTRLKNYLKIAEIGINHPVNQDKINFSIRLKNSDEKQEFQEYENRRRAHLKECLELNLHLYRSLDKTDPVSFRTIRDWIAYELFKFLQVLGATPCFSQHRDANYICFNDTIYNFVETIIINYDR